ncbi:MAG TPA: hypothetical protein VIG55_01800, partial [Methylosinus sp.]
MRGRIACDHEITLLAHLDYASTDVTSAGAGANAAARAAGTRPIEERSVKRNLKVSLGLVYAAGAVSTS